MTAWRMYVLLLVLITSVVCAADSASSVMTPAQYGAELDRMLAATQQRSGPGPQIRELLKDLPPAWQVQSGQQKFEISTDWLQRDLQRLQVRSDPKLQKTISERLQSLRAELEAYERPANDVSRQRAMLAGILSRREFRDLHGPNWVERLEQRLVEALIHLLERFVTSSAIPTVGRIFVYSLIGIAVLVLAIWVYRSLRRGEAMERVVPEDLLLSAKEWTVWMSEAREAARRENWREAIHLAYWAGISFLEAAGTWRPDRARTPREYLRLLPPSSEFQPALRALTHDFEVVWYGNQAADAEAFSLALEKLEQLGCL